MLQNESKKLKIPNFDQFTSNLIKSSNGYFAPTRLRAGDECDRGKKEVFSIKENHEKRVAMTETMVGG